MLGGAAIDCIQSADIMMMVIMAMVNFNLITDMVTTNPLMQLALYHMIQATSPNLEVYIISILTRPVQ